MENKKHLSKKEKRVLRKEEKKKEKLLKEKKAKIKKYFFWIIIIGLGISFFYGLIKIASQKSPDIDSLKTVKKTDWVKGNEQSGIVLIEYSDFQCPACKSYFPIVKQIVDEFGEQITFVYRHFPLSQIHANAQLAAQASEASGKQGKFWEMHDILFEKQDGWSEEKNAKDIFIQYAKDLNLNEEQFRSDIDSQEIKNKVKNNYNSGQSQGVDGTPTFFLNGKKLKSIRSYEDFKEKITKEISSF